MFCSLIQTIIFILVDEQLLCMSNRVATKLELMDPVHKTEVRNYPDKTVIVAALLAGHTDEEVDEVEERARSLGYFPSRSTSLNGSYALKFVKKDRGDSRLP